MKSKFLRVVISLTFATAMPYIVEGLVSGFSYATPFALLAWPTTAALAIFMITTVVGFCCNVIFVKFYRVTIYTLAAFVLTCLFCSGMATCRMLCMSCA